MVGGHPECEVWIGLELGHSGVVVAAACGLDAKHDVAADCQYVEHAKQVIASFAPRIPLLNNGDEREAALFQRGDAALGWAAHGLSRVSIQFHRSSSQLYFLNRD